jgi:hypothetical protein
MRFQVASTVRSEAFRSSFCEDLFDRIEVGAVGRKKEELCAGGSDGTPDCLCFVAAEIVDDDNVAGFERRHEDLFDVSREALAVYRSIDDTGSRDLIAAQSCQINVRQ